MAKVKTEIEFKPVSKGWYVTNVGGIAITGVLALTTGLYWIAVLFVLAVALHLGEAAYVALVTRGSKSMKKWLGQTLAVGFPSLIALRSARKNT
jgi:uncharacterized membrane protein